MLHGATSHVAQVTRSRVQRAIMANITWSRFHQSA